MLSWIIKRDDRTSFGSRLSRRVMEMQSELAEADTLLKARHEVMRSTELPRFLLHADRSETRDEGNSDSPSLVPLASSVLPALACGFDQPVAPAVQPWCNNERRS